MESQVWQSILSSWLDIDIEGERTKLLTSLLAKNTASYFVLWTKALRIIF